jgi:hypothetical protein
VFAAAATLTKGPPALMVIALAGYGAIVLGAIVRSEPVAGRLAHLVATVTGLAFAGLALAGVRGSADALGVMIDAVIGACVGYGLARLARREVMRTAWLGLAHTHPVVVLGVSAVAFWWWGSEVSARIGPELAVQLAREQADNDLNLFVPASPLKNLEALVYGCGVGSIVMLVAVWWWVKYRPAPGAGGVGIMVPVAWVVLSFCALSIFGKGVARYLTPVWPGVAMLAAAWLVRPRVGAERAAGGARGRAALGAACAVLGLGQTWWYAHGREVFEHERSPSAMMRQLTALPNGPARFGSFEFYTPALDYYAGSYVQPIVNAQMGVAVAGGPAWTLEALVRDVRDNGPMIVLCRDRSLDASLASPVERLRAAGLRVEPVEVAGVFRIDNGRTPVRAVRVDP